jgi:hypothetical protein
VKLRDCLAIDVCQSRVEQGLGFGCCGDFGLNLSLLLFEELELGVESKSVGAPIMASTSLSICLEARSRSA